tara:strand:+ start:364 stop:777 length:414 start_codon:yes stop_codon:yes gene_type:complete
MGYKYSVWLVFKHDDICCTLKHIPHVTLMRNMSYDNAFQYYRELLWNGYNKINVVIHRPGIVFTNTWGYYITMHPKTYLDIELKSEKYKGEFIDNPHLIIDYMNKKGIDYKGKTKVEGTICLVNTMSDNPSLWKIIL